MDVLGLKQKIAHNIMRFGFIDTLEKKQYLVNILNRTVTAEFIGSRKNSQSLIEAMTKIIADKIKNRFSVESSLKNADEYQDAVKTYMTKTLEKGDNGSYNINGFSTINLGNDVNRDVDDRDVDIDGNSSSMVALINSLEKMSQKIDLGFYRHKYEIEYINLDTFGFVYDDIVSNINRFNLVTQYNFQGDILIKKPLSNITRIRIMPFRIPQYVLNAPSFNRSPITTTVDDYFVGDYMHVKTPATRVVGIQIEEILDKIKTGINVDVGTTTVFNNPTYANIPNQFKTVKNSILADCVYETGTYDETFQCLTTLVTPRNDGYIYLQSSLNKLDSITISLTDTVSDIYLPSPAINCISFVAAGVTQLLVTTATNGTALLPIGVEHRAYITDFKLDYDNIDESKLTTIDKPTFVKEYLLQYLNTRGVPVTVTRNGSSTNELIVNIVPPPYYTGTIYAKENFKVSIINRRVLIPIQIEQLREEIKKS